MYSSIQVTLEKTEITKTERSVMQRWVQKGVPHKVSTREFVMCDKILKFSVMVMATQGSAFVKALKTVYPSYAFTV